MVWKERTSTPVLDWVACHFDSLQENWTNEQKKNNRGSLQNLWIWKDGRRFYRKSGYGALYKRKSPFSKHLDEPIPARFAESYLPRGMIPSSWKVEETFTTWKLGVQKNLSEQIHFWRGFIDSQMLDFVYCSRIRLEAHFIPGYIICQHSSHDRRSRLDDVIQAV